MTQDVEKTSSYSVCEGGACMRMCCDAHVEKTSSYLCVGVHACKHVMMHMWRKLAVTRVCGWVCMHAHMS